MKKKTIQSKDVCEISFIHKEKTENAKKNMKSDHTLTLLSDTFSALSDPTRAKIINALLIEELCVCDLAYLIRLSVSAVSHQLRLLRNLRIIESRKEGKIVFYSLTDSHIASLFHQGLEHVGEKTESAT